MEKEKGQPLSFTTPLLVIISIILLTISVGITSLKGVILDIEYTKVGGKANYEKVAEINKEQAKAFIEQYEKSKQKPVTGVAPNNALAPTGNTGTTAPVVGAEAKVLTKEIMASVLKDAPLYGKIDSKVVILEYSDLECPFCKKHYVNTMKSLKNDYKGKAGFVFKSYPLSFHANAKKEHIGSLCALKVGGVNKYEEFLGGIFDKTTSGGIGFDIAKLPDLAKEIGLDTKKFSECMSSTKEIEKRVDAEMSEGQTVFGITGTPGTVVLNKETGTYKVFNGAVPASNIRNVVDELLK